MSFIEITAYKCTCERCKHTWKALSLPRTCAACRSPYWDVQRGLKNFEASPKNKEIADLQELISSINPREEHIKIPPPVINDYYSEPTLNYE